jgi:hypothetical protein
VDGSAKAGADYIGTSGTRTFNPGPNLTTTFPITIVNNLLYNPDKSLTLTLSVSDGVVIAPPPARGPLGFPVTATLTITNEQPPPTVQFISNTFVVTEGVGLAPITVTLNVTSSVTTTAAFTTSDGTAQAGVDYTPVITTVVITPTFPSRIVTIPITDDDVFTGDRTLQVTLADPGDATLGAPVTATLILREDDRVLVYLPLLMNNYNPYNEVEPNNSAAQANPILVGFDYFGKYDGDGSNTERDYFVFTTTVAGPATISMSGLVPTSQLMLRDANDNPVFISPGVHLCFRGGGDYEPCIIESLPAARYYVRVTVTPSVVGTYSIRVTQP